MNDTFAVYRFFHQCSNNLLYNAELCYAEEYERVVKSGEFDKKNYEDKARRIEDMERTALTKLNITYRTDEVADFMKFVVVSNNYSLFMALGSAAL